MMQSRMLSWAAGPGCVKRRLLAGAVLVSATPALMYLMLLACSELLRCLRRHGAAPLTQHVELVHPVVLTDRNGNAPPVVQLLALYCLLGWAHLSARPDYILVIDCGSTGTRM